jgi:hypothetical protein
MGSLSSTCTSGILRIVSSLSEVATRVSEDEAESEGEMVMALVPDPITDAEQAPSVAGSSKVEPNNVEPRG